MVALCVSFCLVSPSTKGSPWESPESRLGESEEEGRVVSKQDEVCLARVGGHNQQRLEGWSRSIQESRLFLIRAGEAG